MSSKVAIEVRFGTKQTSLNFEVIDSFKKKYAKCTKVYGDYIEREKYSMLHNVFWGGVQLFLLKRLNVCKGTYLTLMSDIDQDKKMLSSPTYRCIIS